MDTPCNTGLTDMKNNNDDISQSELEKAMAALPDDQRADIEAKIKDLEEKLKNAPVPEEGYEKPLTFSEKLANDMKERAMHKDQMRRDQINKRDK